MRPRIRLAASLCLALSLTGCWLPTPRPHNDRPTPHITPPQGMKAVTFPQFAFAVPSNWTPQGTGDPEWGTGNESASASFGTILKCPSRTRPEPLETGITGRADLSSTRPLQVPGAGGGWRYDLTGDPKGPRSQLHTWLPNCDSELRVTIFAERATVEKIADSLVVQQSER